MDRKEYASVIEAVRAIAGISLIFVTGDWFGINIYFPYGSVLMIGYFVLTLIAGFYFTYIEQKPYSADLIS